MRQRKAKKKGRTYHTTSQAPSKDPNAMEVNASRQKEERNRCTYMAFMKGKCYGCGSPDHAKKDGQHNRDICGHCKKVGHRSPVCFSKYMGKPIAAKAAASQESPEASGSKEKATVMTPPMVGSTWPRVRLTLGSDCLPTLSQGTASFHLSLRTY